MANIPDKSEIKNAINEYCTVKVISKNDLATQIDVSPATLSKIEKDDWQSINDRMWLKIWNYVKPLLTADIYQTQDFATVISLCENTQNNHFMTGLIGDTGMGKTTALKTYARKENVYYIYFDMNMKPKHFLFELGRLLGFEMDSNPYEMVKTISDTLNQKISPLIIIDEAGKLSDQMLMMLHVLRDKTANNCGIVLAGMPYFRANLIKKSNKQKIGISEFLSRVMIWNELEGLKQKEVLFICEKQGVTDTETIKSLKSIRRFRDLMNQILLHKQIN
jgi:DNA transposition AAA+ family ATPase